MCRLACLRDRRARRADRSNSQELTRHHAAIRGLGRNRNGIWPLVLNEGSFFHKVFSSPDYRKILNCLETGAWIFYGAEICLTLWQTTCFTRRVGLACPLPPGGTMKDTNQPDDWRSLCELASEEEDPQKLMELVSKISCALEERSAQPKARGIVQG